MLFRDFRPIDTGPGDGTNVPRRVHIRMVGVSTGHTAELCLRSAVGFGRMATCCARLAGVGGRNQHDIHAGKLGFVLDERAQLMESPAAHLRPLCLAKPCPSADAFEVFQGHPALGAFGLGNERFGNTMIFVRSKSPLFTTQALELASNVLGAKPATLFPRGGFLQASAKCVLPSAHGFHRIAAVALPVAVRGKVCNTQVHAKEIRSWCLGAVWQIDGHQQKPLSIFAPYQITLSFGVGKALLLIFAHDHGHDDAPKKRQQRDAIWPLETHKTLVVGDGGERPKVRTFSFVALVGFTDLGDATHRHLGRQPKALAQGGVVVLLQCDFVGSLSAKRLSRQPIGSGVERTHGRFKRQGLLRRRQKLRLQGQLHALDYSQSLSMHQDWRRRFLPRLKSGASAPGVL